MTKKKEMGDALRKSQLAASTRTKSMARNSCLGWIVGCLLLFMSMGRPFFLAPIPGVHSYCMPHRSRTFETATLIPGLSFPVKAAMRSGRPKGIFSLPSRVESTVSLMMNKNDPNDNLEKKKGGSIWQGIQSFWQELDAFMDDASARRLGNGAAFYGKRRSNFYGEEDPWKKRDRDQPDPMEDYQGPMSSGLFRWMPDEEGQLRPVTRLKQQNLERPPSFWDRVYSNNNDKDTDDEGKNK